MGSPLTYGRPARRRALLAMLCLGLIVVATAVQVMHHCTALELNREPGSAPVFCAVCMTVQVAALAFTTLVIIISQLPGIEPIALPPIAPILGACFALSVRPPPSL